MQLQNELLVPLLLDHLLHDVEDKVFEEFVRQDYHWAPQQRPLQLDGSVGISLLHLTYHILDQLGHIDAPELLAGAVSGEPVDPLDQLVDGGDLLLGNVDATDRRSGGVHLCKFLEPFLDPLNMGLDVVGEQVDQELGHLPRLEYVPLGLLVPGDVLGIDDDGIGVTR